MQKHQVEAVVAEMRRLLKEQREQALSKLRVREERVCSQHLARLIMGKPAMSYLVVRFDRHDTEPQILIEPKKHEALRRKLAQESRKEFAKVYQAVDRIEDDIRACSLSLTLAPADQATSTAQRETGRIKRLIEREFAALHRDVPAAMKKRQS